MPMFEPDLVLQLRQDADRCVKCGLCLAECPTYRADGDENESPRGRIALIEGLAQGHIAADADIAAHLHNCLLCLRCERVCPSGVRYGRLMDGARRILPRAAHPAESALNWPVFSRFLGRLSEHLPTALRNAPGSTTRILRLAIGVHDHSAPPPAGTYAPPGTQVRGTWGLFLGCAESISQGELGWAAIRLLNALGYRVEVPGDQMCCGARAAHRGDHRQAQTCIDGNICAFGGQLDGLISLSSGCGTFLDTYPDDKLPPHRDLMQVLVEDERLGELTFAALTQRALLHIPCTLENVYRGRSWPELLLQQIPGLEIAQLPDSGGCCGAAGDHMLRKPQFAHQLRECLLDACVGVDMVLTSNVGCALHLADGLALRTAPPRVLHPVQLLATQLDCGSDHPGA